MMSNDTKIFHIEFQRRFVRYCTDLNSEQGDIKIHIKNYLLYSTSVKSAKYSADLNFHRSYIEIQYKFYFKIILRGTIQLSNLFVQTLHHDIERFMFLQCNLVFYSVGVNRDRLFIEVQSAELLQYVGGDSEVHLFRSHLS